MVLILAVEFLAMLYDYCAMLGEIYENIKDKCKGKNKKGSKQIPISSSGESSECYNH